MFSDASKREHYVEMSSLLTECWISIIAKKTKKKQLQNKILLKIVKKSFSAGIYLLKVNNRNTRTKRKICSKLTIKIHERRHWRYCPYC